MLSVLLLLPALAADTLTAAAACAAREIEIPQGSRWVIALVSSGFLLISMTLGDLIGRILPGNICKVISFTVLFLLGIGNCFRSLLQELLKKVHFGVKQMHFRLWGLSFLLSICADETRADADGSRELSAGEAAALSAALSLDALAAGLAGSFPLSSALLAGGVSLPLQLGAVSIGMRLGKSAARLPAFLPELLGGLLMMALAFLRLA